MVLTYMCVVCMAALCTVLLRLRWAIQISPFTMFFSLPPNYLIKTYIGYKTSEQGGAHADQLSIEM